MFEGLRSLLKPQKQTLIVMCVADMKFTHPLADYSRQCSKCHEKVGIYPSSQALIKKFGEDRVEIICNRHVNAGQVWDAKPLPGALEEIGQSIRNPKQEREP